MDTTESSAPHARPSIGEQDDTVEAHYACLERLRPHACIDGWVFVGYVDEHGEERVASYTCRRCAASRLSRSVRQV
jgi:Ni,Fe-hydrogenase III component G